MPSSAGISSIRPWRASADGRQIVAPGVFAATSARTSSSRQSLLRRKADAADTAFCPALKRLLRVSRRRSVVTFARRHEMLLLAEPHFALGGNDEH